MTDYYIVGERNDGTRLVLCGTSNHELAHRNRDKLAAQLEGYRAVVVEEAQMPGEHQRRLAKLRQQEA